MKSATGDHESPETPSTGAGESSKSFPAAALAIYFVSSVGVDRLRGLQCTSIYLLNPFDRRDTEYLPCIKDLNLRTVCISARTGAWPIDVSESLWGSTREHSGIYTWQRIQEH